MSAHDVYERFEAVEGVRELLWRYATTIDRLPPIEELADFFTPDAVLINPKRHEGRRAILMHYDSVLSSLSWARHHIVNSMITLERPGRARHRAYYLALLGGDSGALMVYGDYDDVVLRGEDGRWRFQEKGNHPAGSTTLPAGVDTRG